MKLWDNRVWAIVILAAFLLLWFAGVGVAYAAPVEEPLPQPAPAVQSAGARAIGTVGWCIVGAGFAGVAFGVFFEGRFRRRSRRRRRSSPVTRQIIRPMRTVYAPHGPARYRRNIERRY